MTSRFNEDFTMMILNGMRKEKKKILENALARNAYFTSARILEFGKITIYKEGWYVELKGCQCGFKVFAKDNDGKFEYIRKPNESKLNKIATYNLHMNECDYDAI